MYLADLRENAHRALTRGAGLVMALLGSVDEAQV